MNAKIDFNCDMGESFGIYRLGQDSEVVKYITSANIACGFHAGDPNWINATVKLVEEHDVAVGAHPGFPDMSGFGRRNISATPGEIRNDVIYQMGALQAFTTTKKLQHVKPHGAMYNIAAVDKAVAMSICEAALEVDPNVILLALANSSWVRLAEDMGLRVAREAFADRALCVDGTLTPRSQPGAVLHDVGEIVERSLRIVTESKTVAFTGEVIDVEADSICLHGDTPGAVDLARALHDALTKEGVTITSLAELV